MLSPNEFTIGSFESAAPSSLVLPRTEHETAAIIGELEGEPTAILLAGQFAFHFISCAGNNNWQGLIIPGVRVEVDEASLFDPDYSTSALGSVVRSDTRLVIRAKEERAVRQMTAITLQDDLPPAGNLKAAFTKWQIVIGAGSEKRVLWHTPEANEEL